MECPENPQLRRACAPSCRAAVGHSQAPHVLSSLPSPPPPRVLGDLERQDGAGGWGAKKSSPGLCELRASQTLEPTGLWTPRRLCKGLRVIV